MSVTQFIKDYADALNFFYDISSGNVKFLPFLQFTLIYLIKWSKFLIGYIITCRWLIDFCSIKIVIPEILNANLMDEYSLENPMLRFFTFFETENRAQSPYLEAIINSFFYCLPFSVGNILWLKRVTVEGAYGAIAAGLAILISQIVLFLGVVFGVRFFTFPWFSYELIHYVAGLVLIFALIERIVNKPLMRIKRTEKEKLKKIFLFHLALAFTEQTTFFPYISNLNLAPEPTLLEGFSAGVTTNSLNNNILYFLGLLTGLILWYTLLGVSFRLLGRRLTTIFKFTYSQWVRGVNRHSMLILIAMAITSIPYYSFDFVATSPFGFTKHDQGAQPFHLKSYTRDYKKGRLGENSLRSSYDTDTATFDNGRYTVNREVEITYEDLNHQGEYAWRTRNDRNSLGARGRINRWMRKFMYRLKKYDYKHDPMKTQQRFKERVRQRELRQLKRLQDTYRALYKDENEIDLETKKFDIYATDLPIVDEKFIERFLEDYQSNLSLSVFPDKSYSKGQQPPYIPFGEITRFGFEVFPNILEQDTDNFEKALGKKIKSRYYKNYVYKALLNSDISIFLTRQPKQHLLSWKDENDLFTKRQILGNYYDSIREYSRLPNYGPYRELFLGPKSYANRVYNQQFKGTLKIVKRLFSITLAKEKNPFKKSILKFDQPLYRNNEQKPIPILHEELMDRLSELKNIKPFLEETNPIPFYAGWDENLRKFSVTNYLLSHSNSNLMTNFYLDTDFETVHFLAWPIPDPKMNAKQRAPKPPFHLKFNSAIVNLISNIYDDPAYKLERDLFEYQVEDQMELVSETLPSLIRRVDLREREKIHTSLQPLRGGYAWANSDPSKIRLKEDLLDYLPPQIREKAKEIQSKLKIRKGQGNYLKKTL